MDLLERSERQGCPQHLDATMVYRDSAWRCCVCNSHVVMVEYVTLPAATYQGAVEALTEIRSWCVAGANAIEPRNVLGQIVGVVDGALERHGEQ